jgi:hypothetical protein
MAKKKQKSVDLSLQNLSFKEKQTEYKLIRYYPSKMSLDVMIFEGKEKKMMQDFPFAHLPREIKK